MINKKKRDEYLSPILLTAQFFFCGVPLRMDSYSGCSHLCAYCFARAQDAWQTAKASRDGSILTSDKHRNPVRHILAKALDTDAPSKDVTVEWLRHRVPIHWGGMSDPFQPCEAKHKISLSFLDTLNWYQYPTVISTKGKLAIESEYLSRLRDGKYAVQVSLISDDDKLMQAIEPGAPSATERLNMLETLAQNGIWTACRIQPLIPASPIEDGLERLIQKLAGVGVKHIVVETYKIPLHIPMENRRRIDVVCGGKVEQEYTACGGGLSNMEVLLPSWRIWQFLEPARDWIHKYGMTFGAGDNAFRDTGDVKCCCGIDNLPGFENYWQYHTATAAEIAKEKGFVTLDDMERVWHGEQTIQVNIQCDWRKVDGVRKSWPAAWWTEKIWNLGDDRSPNCLVNLDKVYKEGQIIYVYNNKLDSLKNMQRVQEKMF